MEGQIAEVRDKGYAVMPGFVPPRVLAALNEQARVHLQERRGPLELEADLRYPGAPASRDAAGGGTVRRLLDAYGRGGVFAECAAAAPVRDWMEAYFGERVMLSRAHHNCVMTKHPRYGSMTGWHRDIRYWAFEREELVSVWLALGEERVQNGALWLVPGSQHMTFASDRFDAAKFFRTDHEANREVIRAAVSPRLEPGDALFFHCRTLHSAGVNLGEAVKFSLVFTYRGSSNAPRAGTRSASMDDVAL